MRLASEHTKPASRHLANRKQLVDITSKTQYLYPHTLAFRDDIAFWSRVIDGRSVGVVIIVSWQVLYLL